jgi:outer membrane protein assembly factor BamD
LYSKADRTLWMLGNVWEGTEKKEFASIYYARIVRNYPLSPLVPDAKSRLKALGAPVPQPDPTAVAWMTAEQNAPRPHTSLAKKPMGFFRNGPGQELQVASRAGKPNMTPEAESEAGTDILTGGGSPSRIGGAGTGIVATVTPGGSSVVTGGAGNTVPTTDGSTPPNTEAQPDPNAPATADPKATTGTAESAPKTDGSPDAAGQPSDAAKTDAAAAQDGTQNGAKTDNKKESTSKKKKGLRKIVPW